MAEQVLALSRLADFPQVVVALVGENILAQFQHVSSPSGALRAAAGGGGEDGVDDRFVSGAAADVARDRLDNLGAARRWIAVEKRLGGQQQVLPAITTVCRKILPRNRLELERRAD